MDGSKDLKEKHYLSKIIKKADQTGAVLFNSDILLRTKCVFASVTLQMP